MVKKLEGVMMQGIMDARHEGQQVVAILVLGNPI
jgi:hypothetical protein